MQNWGFSCVDSETDDNEDLMEPAGNLHVHFSL